MSRCVPSESYSSQRVCFLPSISPLFLNSQTLDFSESELLFTRPRRAETGFACSLFFQCHLVDSLASVPFVTSQWVNSRCTLALLELLVLCLQAHK